MQTKNMEKESPTSEMRHNLQNIRRWFSVNNTEVFWDKTTHFYCSRWFSGGIMCYVISLVVGYTDFVAQRLVSEYSKKVQMGHVNGQGD